MTLPVFPSFAKIERTDDAAKPDFAIRRTDMDDGLAKQSPRRSLPITTQPVTVWLDTPADRATFQNWVCITLNGGAGWFTWTDPLTNATRQGRIVKGEIEYTHVGGPYHKAKFSLEILG